MNAILDERRVLTYGHFDPFGPDDVRFLRRLAQMGERLIVGLASDGLARQLGQDVQSSFEDRREMLLACRHVDRVIRWDYEDQARTDIVNYNVSLLVMGEAPTGADEDLSALAQVLYITHKTGADAGAPETLDIERDQRQIA